MSPRLRSLAGSLALLMASILGTLLVAELAVRLAFRFRGGGKERRELSRYVEHDEYLGWRKRPGARVVYDRREYRVPVEINSLGLRDLERSHEKPPWTFRILALGDSFIEGYTVPLEETLTQTLERRLNGPGCQLEVLNGGTAGYSTDQEYLFYRHEGHRYGADVVLLFLFYNDLLTNTLDRYWGEAKPLLRVAEDGATLELTNHPVARPRKQRPAQRAAIDTLQGSAALFWVADRLARGAPQAFDALSVLGLWEPLGGDQPDEQLRVYKRRRQPKIEAAWEITDRILRALGREAEAAGARFAVVYVPSRMEVIDRDWELTRLRFELNEAWERGLVAERVAEIGANAGFPILDLTPALRAVDRGVLGRPYLVYDGHWNTLGHATAAAAVEDFLRELGWLPACARASHGAR